jgi:hypothetical protein
VFGLPGSLWKERTARTALSAHKDLLALKETLDLLALKET